MSQLTLELNQTRLPFQVTQMSCYDCGKRVKTAVWDDDRRRCVKCSGILNAEQIESMGPKRRLVL